MALNGTSFNQLQQTCIITRSNIIFSALERDDRRLSDGFGPWTVVESLVAGILKEKGHILYYQEADITLPEGNLGRYYVLVFGREKIIMGVDSKHDLRHLSLLWSSAVVGLARRLRGFWIKLLIWERINGPSDKNYLMDVDRQGLFNEASREDHWTKWRGLFNGTII